MTPLEIHNGDVEGILRGNDREILRELMSVIEATRDKSIRLTKSGIPPKPLWSSVNDRLIWQDPKSILYDWDEVDQVRFIYSLASELMLVAPDLERILDIGPGADRFFLAAPSQRSALLMRAYLSVDDWDERCDARSTQGHRHNFGQTFRRDFRIDVERLRAVLIETLRGIEAGVWVTSFSLAARANELEPALLVSEDDEVPEVVEGDPDPEVRRLVDYWLFLAARFGWVDLSRTPETLRDEGGERLLRLTPIGWALINNQPLPDPVAELGELAAVRPFIIQPNGDVVLYRDDADVADEYLLRRIADNLGVADWDEPVVTYRVTRASTQSAVDSGLDIAELRRRLLLRSQKDAPSTFEALVGDIERRLSSTRILRGLSTVEFEEDRADVVEALREAGFMVFDRLVVVAWPDWPRFCSIAGEPTEGFVYPSEEPLGKFSGNRLELEWPVLPMVARDLLDKLGLAGEPLAADITEELLGELALAGWTPRAVAEALATLTDQSLPKRLKSELRS